MVEKHSYRSTMISHTHTHTLYIDTHDNDRMEIFTFFWTPKPTVASNQLWLLYCGNLVDQLPLLKCLNIKSTHSRSTYNNLRPQSCPNMAKKNIMKGKKLYHSIPLQGKAVGAEKPAKTRRQGSKEFHRRQLKNSSMHILTIKFGVLLTSTCLCGHLLAIEYFQARPASYKAFRFGSKTGFRKRNAPLNPNDHYHALLDVLHACAIWCRFL